MPKVKEIINGEEEALRSGRIEKTNNWQQRMTGIIKNLLSRGYSEAVDDDISAAASYYCW